jgi:hypothetical protein
MGKRARATTDGAPASSAYIELNVGGFIHATTKEELATAPAGRLRSYESAVRDKDGLVFFARDGVSFEALLSYLRTGVMLVPRDSTPERVACEAAYFFDVVPTRPVTEATHAVLLDPQFRLLVAHGRSALRRLVRCARRKQELHVQLHKKSTWTMHFEHGPAAEVTNVADLKTTLFMPASDDASVAERMLSSFTTTLGTEARLQAVARALETQWRADVVNLTPGADGKIIVRCFFTADAPTYKAIAEAMAMPTDAPSSSEDE